MAEDIADYYLRLMETRSRAAAVYEAAWRGISTRAPTVLDFCKPDMIRYHEELKNARPGFDPKIYVAWHVMIGSTPFLDKLKECDFPDPYSIEKLLERIIDGSEPGSRPHEEPPRPARSGDKPHESKL